VLFRSSLSELLARKVISSAVLSTEAVLVMNPADVGVTVTVLVTVVPLGTVPRLQVTSPKAWEQPVEAETNVTPVGNLSVSTTPGASSKPSFVNSRV
jgi:hypothetical protein